MIGLDFLAQSNSEFWSKASGSGTLLGFVIGTMILGFLILFALLQTPAQSRRKVVWFFTFFSGLFYVLLWLWPAPHDRAEGDASRGFSEHVSFFLQDSTNIFGGLSNILTAMLLLLGVFSLIRVHIVKLAKQQKDWVFSVVLLVSLFSIAIVGYNGWLTELRMEPAELERIGQLSPNDWPTYKKAQDFMFDGLLQAMDAAMFSIIAFYILSAAYRAFRIRSVEATILLASALLVMLSLLGLAELYWNDAIKSISGGNDASFVNNFKLTEIASFIRRSFQVPGLRAIDFGIGIGALAMGLRLWLGLERSGGSN